LAVGLGFERADEKVSFEAVELVDKRDFYWVAEKDYPEAV